jgi:histidine triad (HIT) family protein
LAKNNAQFKSLAAAKEGRDENRIGHMFKVASRMAKKLGLENGYRIVLNEGKYGQQQQPNLCLHVLGGQQLCWPPVCGQSEESKKEQEE